MTCTGIEVTREPSEVRTIVKLIGLGDWGQHVLAKLVHCRIPYEQAIGSREFSERDHEFQIGAHLLFIAVDPNLRKKLN